ncbi:hypothetical protein H2359_004698 [Salmonella enterica]|nr:hypothetical protein [Salmonella enterica]ECK0358935.1 hypothetical protein [Salmonella enterica subsp. enterica serovar Urbana]EAZ5519994.1 hypothetical protein [Salmonella enterica]EBB1669513.1 hypothetical protein [Salmonella enterica]EBE1722286.1 hypothetical protein [Salmonella enterica]
MNIQNLKNKLKPKLYEHKLEGETVYIHRPSARDFSKCDNVENTLIYCVKDENGDPIFASEDIDGRINVSSIDFQYQNELYGAILKLVTEMDKVDEVEKK